MRVSRSLQSVCLFSAIILAAACTRAGQNMMIKDAIEKDSNGSAKVDLQDDGAMHIETKDGTYNAGNNQLPSDWPTDAPVYAGATVQFSGSANPATGKPGAAAVLLTTDAADAVIAFYKAELAKQGWSIASTMQSQGTTILGATKGNRTMSLMIGSSEGQTMITIGVGEQ